MTNTMTVITPPFHGYFLRRDYLRATPAPCDAERELVERRPCGACGQDVKFFPYMKAFKPSTYRVFSTCQTCGYTHEHDTASAGLEWKE